MNEQQQQYKTEQQIQRDICVTIWNELPVTRHCLYHIKQELDCNVTKQQLIMLAQQKAAGLLPGIQDLHFTWAGITYKMELKDSKGYVSLAQRVIHAANARQGVLTWLFRDSESCIEFVRYIVANAPITPNSHLYTIFEMHLMSAFGKFVSPYSEAQMYNSYYDQYLAEVERKKENRRRS